MGRKTFDELCDYLTIIGESTINSLFDRLERVKFNPAEAANRELSNDLLLTLPFGPFLKNCAEANPSQKPDRKDDTRIHMLYVVSGMTDALKGDRSEFLAAQPAFSTFHARLIANAAEAGFKQSMLRKVCIVAALYHDLGKAIANERHPYEGYHIMKDLGQVSPASGEPNNPEGTISASKDFRSWFEGSKDIGADEEAANYYLRFFMKLMRYHDMWGNITTGEASMVMLSSAIDLNDRASGAVVFLGHLALLNLADQFGTFPLFCPIDNKPKRLEGDMLASLLTHWKTVEQVLLDAREHQEGTREALLKSAGQASETVDRLYALLWASGIHVKEKRDVNDILKAVCGGRYYAFCEDFGMVRLSYALRFFRSLRERADKENKTLPSDKQFTPYRQASLVLTVLKRILDTYEPLIRANKEQRSETGIEMSSLARSTEVLNSIIQTLLGQERESALSWIDDEVSAFPCG